MSVELEKLVGQGAVIAVDFLGGTSYVPLATVCDGDKLGESKWKMANTSLLAQAGDTFAKTSYDPGTFKISVIYRPGESVYESLKTNFKAFNAPAPHWQITFATNDSEWGAGSGSSGATTVETFYGHIDGLSREIKRDSFLMAEFSIKLDGDI